MRISQLITAQRARLGRFRPLLHTALGKCAIGVLRKGYQALASCLGMAYLPGERLLDSSKPTVLVVSHEATPTGAPILALNLCQTLSTSHNVIVLLLRGGPLLQPFQAASSALLMTRLNLVNRKLLHRALSRACQGLPVEFALVNTVLSAPVLKPLYEEGIPSICLLHEFVAYIKPLDLFTMVGLWASRVVCSAKLTWNDVLRHCPQLADVPVVTLPQGPCELPSSKRPKHQKLPIAGAYPDRDAEHFLKRLPEQAFLVLGAGSIQPRKGVDLFIAVAQQIRLQAPDLEVRFAWIGSGYDPDKDFCVSVWIEDQIDRSGLSHSFSMLDESNSYKDLIERSNIFLVSSRLDPMPNVAIDAMLSGTPVLCFDKACGVAELLAQSPELYRACVAPYFDCDAMASKASELLKSQTLLNHVSQLTLQHANGWFQMSTYVGELLRLADIARHERYQEDADINLLAERKLVNRNFYWRDLKLNDYAISQQYLINWRSNIRPFKPFPGFHPGIYREKMLAPGSRRDPLIHWYEEGQPPGPWQVPVIQPPRKMEIGMKILPTSVALHIHIFYPELLAPILQKLKHNQLHPDLFLSYSTDEQKEIILNTLEKFDLQGRLLKMPNRGRDLGPLLTELGMELDRNYKFHGHLHTKNSLMVQRSTAAHWREFLLINLLGEAGMPMADQILTTLQHNSQLGLVFPDDPSCLGWTENRTQADALAKRLQLPPLPNAINFPMGTMFWARQGALSQLYNLGLCWDDLPEEPLTYDGTMLHAIERLLPQICLANDFTYAVTNVPGISR